MLGLELLLIVLLPAAAAWLVIWLLTKLLGRVAGIVGSSLVLGGLAYSWWSLASTCAQPPRYVPPKPGSGSEGTMVSACDAPFGTLAYYLIDTGFPLCLALCALGFLLIVAHGPTPPAVFAGRSQK
jgi:hypothetical protein